jgi:methylase of polypeptide subunit release factors
MSGLKEQRLVASLLDASCNLDVFARRHFRPPFVSRRQIHRSIQQRHLTVNGCVVEFPTHVVKDGDKVELLATPEQLSRLLVEKNTLGSLACEPFNFVVLLKPAGMPVRGDGACTVTAALSSSLTNLLPQASGTHRASDAITEYAIVASVGRPFRGPVLVGLSQRSVCFLRESLNAGEIHFRYRVLVHGKYPFVQNHLGNDKLVRGVIHISLVLHAKSTGGLISLLDVTTSGGDDGLRRALSDMGFPIVGNAAGTRRSKGSNSSGVYAACIQIKFPFTDAQAGYRDSAQRVISVDIDVPEKFKRFVEREAIFSATKELKLEAKPTAYPSLVSASTALPGDNFQIVGFSGYGICVSDVVMTPRASSETLVNLACDCVRESCRQWFRFADNLEGCLRKTMRTPRILDLGTGSGALLIATILRSIPIPVHGVGLDVCEDALAVARRNLEAHALSSTVKLVHGDFADLSCFRGLLLAPAEYGCEDECALNHSQCVMSDSFDVILCNPPYLSRREADRLSGELGGPALAMVANDCDGLKGAEAYFMLARGIAGSPGVLRAGGSLIVELGGRREAHSIAQVFTDIAGLSLVSKVDDHYGFCRCLEFKQL